MPEHTDFGHGGKDGVGIRHQTAVLLYCYGRFPDLNPIVAIQLPK